MPSLLASILPFALLLAPLSADHADSAGDPVLTGSAGFAGDGEPDALSLSGTPQSVALPFGDSFRPESSAQVRIERRVTVRIAPRVPERSSLVAENRAVPPTVRRMVERDADDCVRLSSIAGVQSRPDRLMLFMRDRRIMTAQLEKKCSPRDFYAGFLVEKSKDGQLCVKRDQLHSRVGSKCRVKAIRQLVEAGD
ncbi:hypothetical protein ACXYN8_05585 [Altererythrobacter sp. CAU 1778]